MRLLVVIPHFFGEAGPEPANRSRQKGARGERVAALRATIARLSQNFGGGVFGLDHYRRVAVEVPAAQPQVLDIQICTSGEAHLLEDIADLRTQFEHRPVECNPIMLGFECHKLLRAGAGKYDFYAYVEDDILVHDPQLFAKIALFNTEFGPASLLQANRFELSTIDPIHKLYVDYRINPQLTELYQDISIQPTLELEFARQTLKFERTTYPSAGCFFLDGPQLDLWTRSRSFLDHDISYMSPLDSAVTLSIMKTFRIYKPCLGNAWYLEVQHGSPRWIDGAAREISQTRETT